MAVSSPVANTKSSWLPSSKLVLVCVAALFAVMLLNVLVTVAVVDRRCGDLEQRLDAAIESMRETEHRQRGVVHRVARETSEGEWSIETAANDSRRSLDKWVRSRIDQALEQRCKLPGAACTKGDEGVRGPAGVPGLPGAKGEAGAPGPPGPKGDMGVIVGVKGVKGDMGVSGPRGPTGEKGERGGTTPELSVPSVDVFDDYVVVREGQGATLTCSASGYPRPSVRIVESQESEAVSPRHGNVSVSVFNNGSTMATVSYHIIGVTKEQKGNYVCEARSIMGSATATARMDVEVAVAVHLPSRVIYVRNNSKLSLSCHVTGNPIDHVTWGRLWNGLPLNGSTATHDDSETMSQMLVIGNAAVGDGGVYVCRTSNYFSADEGWVVVSVYSEPAVVSVYQATRAVGQTGHQLICRASGFPMPLITWRETATNKFVHRGRQLTVPAVIPADGMYTCYARSPFGEARGTIAVHGAIGETAGHAGMSCKDIQNRNPNISNSEVYWIKLNDAAPFQVRCDVTTDAGGWLVIGKGTYQGSLVVKQIGSWSGLARVGDEDSVLRASALRGLVPLYNITEMRMECWMASVGRKFHIKTTLNETGRNAIDALSGKKEAKNQVSCGSFVKLPDDTSWMADNCKLWGNQRGMWAKETSKDMFSIPTARYRQYYRGDQDVRRWSITSLECDSTSSSPSWGDYWRLYAR